MKPNASFTLVETLICAAIAVLLASLAIPALRDANIRSEIASAEAKADAMNRAVQAAKIDGLTPPADDIDGLHAWLVENRYLRPEN